LRGGLIAVHLLLVVAGHVKTVMKFEGQIARGSTKRAETFHLRRAATQAADRWIVWRAHVGMFDGKRGLIWESPTIVRLPGPLPK
jgi:hypothetical protein